MNIDIVINKKDVVENLHTLSALLGVKLGAVEHISSTADDVVFIEQLWSAVINELSGLLSPYASFTSDELSVVYKLTMPDNWRNEHADNLTVNCRTYLCNALFALWLDFVKPDSSSLYRAMNTAVAKEIEHILCLRRRP